jgi:hypothetical protein
MVGRAGPTTPAPTEDNALTPKPPRWSRRRALRFMYWVTQIHASSPLSCSPSAPIDTGELFWSIANLQRQPEHLRSVQQDLVDLLNGDLAPETCHRFLHQSTCFARLTQARQGLFGAVLISC